MFGLKALPQPPVCLTLTPRIPANLPTNHTPNLPHHFGTPRAYSPDDPLSYPPYAVNNGNRRAPLYVNTVPMNAVGYGGVRQYDSHNLYALAEVAVTHGALQAILPGSRPFILTRCVCFACVWGNQAGVLWLCP